MTRRFAVLLSALCALLPIVAGCGDDGPQPPARESHLIRLDPENDVKVATAAAPAPVAGSDPLEAGDNRIQQTGDPLDSGGNALAGGDSLGGQDPLSAHGTSNWYWLRGNITGGSMAITVDGVSLGTYTVHMDKEITQMLHPGMNSITFAPERDNPAAPVQAHLEVIYSQMEPGQLPPLVFDTSSMLKSSMPVLKAPPSVYKPVEDSGDAGEPSIPTIGPAPQGLPGTMHEQPTTLAFDAQ
jgi:hypothetical protein